MNILKSKNIKIIYNVYVEDWSSEGAYQEIVRVLNLSGEVPDVVLSSFDAMSTRIVDALDENGLIGKVVLTGQDAQLIACRNIVKGRQSMTVYKPFNLQVSATVDLAYKLANRKTTNKISFRPIFNGRINVPSILIDPISVDKSNLNSTVIHDGFLTEKEVYN
jgi:D-xylose transport system substrate-binding protein